MTFHKRLPPVGSRPGTLAIPPDSPPPKIHLFDYQGEFCTELDVRDPAELERLLGDDPRRRLEVIPEADHFFFACGLGDISRIARDWLASAARAT